MGSKIFWGHEKPRAAIGASLLVWRNWLEYSGGYIPEIWEFWISYAPSGHAFSGGAFSQPLGPGLPKVKMGMGGGGAEGLRKSSGYLEKILKVVVLYYI